MENWRKSRFKRQQMDLRMYDEQFAGMESFIASFLHKDFSVMNKKLGTEK